MFILNSEHGVTHHIDQEFLEPDEDLEDTLNEETISSNLMKFKSNRDSAESEVNTPMSNIFYLSFSFTNIFLKLDR